MQNKFNVIPNMFALIEYAPKNSSKLLDKYDKKCFMIIACQY